MRIDLEQRRAAAAFAVARELGEEHHGPFLRVARELPAMLRRNGLLASWAYLAAKGRKGEASAGSRGYARVRSACLAHLQSTQGLTDDVTRLESLFSEHHQGRPAPLSTLRLQRLTAEATAYSGWLKRAAEALCDTGGGVTPEVSDP